MCFEHDRSRHPTQFCRVRLDLHADELLIEALSLLWALWAAVPGGPDPDLRVGLARPLGVVFAGFTLWLVAAKLEPRWARLVVFLVMLVGLRPG